MEPTKDTFDARAAALDELLGTGRSFDMVTRPLTIAGRRARLWVVNGYAEDALLERAVADTRDLGYSAVVLGTNRGNKAAQSFYKRHGFRKRSSRTFDVGGVRNYDVVMVRDLTA